MYGFESVRSYSALRRPILNASWLQVLEDLVKDKLFMFIKSIASLIPTFIKAVALP